MAEKPTTRPNKPSAPKEPNSSRENKGRPTPNRGRSHGVNKKQETDIAKEIVDLINKLDGGLQAYPIRDLVKHAARFGPNSYYYLKHRPYPIDDLRETMGYPSGHPLPDIPVRELPRPGRQTHYPDRVSGGQDLRQVLREGTHQSYRDRLQGEANQDRRQPQCVQVANGHGVAAGGIRRQNLD